MAYYKPMNKGNYISDWTNRITFNYAQQLTREPFCGLYDDSQNWCISAALKDGDAQYSITCYCKASYRWFLYKGKEEKIMISPDYWPAAVLAAVSVRMFEDLDIVFVSEENWLNRFSWAEYCNISDGFALMQNEPVNRFFIIDGKALGRCDKKQISHFLGEENNLRFLLIDIPENEQQWGTDWIERIIIEHTILQSDADSFSSFLLSALEDNDVKESLRRDEWQELSEYFIKTRNLETIKKFVDRIGYPENMRPIMPGRYSLLMIAIDSNPDFMDEIVSFLLECGDVYRTYSFIDDDDDEDEGYGLAELASDTMDEEKYNKICWLLENGYKADVKELFYIAISFLRYTTECKESDRYIPHLFHKREQNKWLGEAEEKFCSEFRRLSASFSEEVFSYRDAYGKTLLMYASEILYGRYFLPKLYEMILSSSKDPWLIDGDGNNAHRHLKGADEEASDMLRNAGVQDVSINDKNVFCAAFFHSGIVDHAKEWMGQNRYEYIPAVADAICFDCGYEKEIFKKILIELLKGCEEPQKAIFKNDGSNVLMHLLSYRFEPKLFDGILEAGVDINATDWAGDTALTYAIRSVWDNWENNKKIFFLIDHGIDVAIQNKIGETAIHIAARTFRFDEEGWNIIGNIKDKKAFFLSDNYGFTPVMTAFKYMNMPAIRFLMNNGYVQNSDMEYIRKQIDRVNTKSMREVLENLYSRAI